MPNVRGSTNIEAVPPTARMPDAFLDADEIRAATFVRHVEIHDTLGSTNDRAAELARDPHIELPALVVARRQTAGRGRGKNTWWSADGALTFSVLLDPAALGISTANWPQLSLATAVAVCDALGADELSIRSEPARPDTAGSRTPSSHAPTARVSASNGPTTSCSTARKVCGILIESPGGAAPAKDRLIIGIGINVNNSWHSAPRCSRAERNRTLRSRLARPARLARHSDQSLLKAIRERIEQLAAHDPAALRRLAAALLVNGATRRSSNQWQLDRWHLLGNRYRRSARRRKRFWNASNLQRITVRTIRLSANRMRYPAGAHDERIRPLLVADRRFGAVARQHDRVVRQREELVVDRVAQRRRSCRRENRCGRCCRRTARRRRTRATVAPACTRARCGRSSGPALPARRARCRPPRTARLRAAYDRPAGLSIGKPNGADKIQLRIDQASPRRRRRSRAGTSASAA